ncbi:hypothetical protein [Olivibacter sitiensis]|uniref:hypothetical protein n=1 Tax=Olivibacter sitiensis TaxID=376470 RepID=UPI00042664CB|nr:hypothetical protein [Olivibacter sitiensis]
MKATFFNNRWLEVANRLYELKRKKHEAAIKAIVAKLSIAEKYELATFLSFLYRWEFASFLSEDSIKKQYHL